jgi:hypothetical protein
MKGWIYKELRQNWVFVLTVVFLGMYPLLNILCLKYTLNDAGSLDSFRMFEPLCALSGVLVFHSSLLKMNENKIWGYFVTSTSSGYKGYLFVKYVIIFLMTILHLITVLISNVLFINAESAKGISEFTAMPWLFVGYSCLQLLFCAVDLPLTIRMGVRNASTVMVLFWMVLIIGFTAVLISNSNITLTEMLANSREYEAPLIVKLSVILVSLLAYWGSYFLSCRLYLKGVKYCR